MSPSPVIWTVGLQCPPGHEDAFNRWYDEVHVPMLLNGGQVARVSRFRLAPDAHDVAPGARPCPRYQTIYEFDDAAAFDAWMAGPDRAAAGADKTTTWADNPYEVIWAGRYDLMTSMTSNENPSHDNLSRG